MMEHNTISNIELPPGKYILECLETTNSASKGLKKTCTKSEPFNLSVGYGITWGSRMSDIWHTSMITEIELLKENSVVFRTCNSTYLIQEVAE